MAEKEEKRRDVNPLSAGLSEDNLAFYKFLQMEDTPYFSAIGHFISDYASAESAFHILARSLSELGDAEARAIFGGMRLDDLIDRIRSLMRLRLVAEEDKLMVEECIAQLRKIGAIRHRIVHRSVEVKETEILVSNRHTSKTLSVESESLLIADLDKMSNDCRRIFAKIVFFVFPHSSRSQPRETEDAWLNGPWRHKPVMPKNNDQ